MVNSPPQAGGCQCSSGLCRKMKKVFCKEETYVPSEDPIVEEQCIETSALEYGLKYEHALEEPLSTGSLVIVTATPTEDIPRFAINVGCGDSWSDRCDIVLHFNPRMPQRYVVRNSRTRSSWGSEETTSFRSFPFKPGREFTVQLLVAETEWLIAVDGEHFCSYAHRLPAASATWVQVTDISDRHVKVTRTEIYPILGAEPPDVPYRDERHLDAVADEDKFSSNMFAKLPRGIEERQQLVVRGRVRALPHSFHLDLAETWREWPHPAVHLHVNPRLCAAPTRNRQLVVFNSWLDGCWGSEVRQATGKIIGGSRIELRIVRGASEWSVWCDNVLLGELSFRADPNRVRAVRLRGDLRPTNVFVAPTDT